MHKLAGFKGDVSVGTERWTIEVYEFETEPLTYGYRMKNRTARTIVEQVNYVSPYHAIASALQHTIDHAKKMGRHYDPD